VEDEKLPRESPLKDYIVSIKHSLVKIAVGKLAEVAQSQNKDEVTKA